MKKLIGYWESIILIICTKNESNLPKRYWDMVPDGQKVRTDGWADGIDGWRQNYISPTSSGDNKCKPIEYSFCAEPWKTCKRWYIAWTFFVFPNWICPKTRQTTPFTDKRFVDEWYRRIKHHHLRWNSHRVQLWNLKLNFPSWWNCYYYGTGSIIWQQPLFSYFKSQTRVFYVIYGKKG